MYGVHYLLIVCMLDGSLQHELVTPVPSYFLGSQNVGVYK